MKSQFQFAELAKYRKQHKNNQQAGSLITSLPAFFYDVCVFLHFWYFCNVFPQSMLEKAFPRFARPTLRYISSEFGCRSPLRRPHPGKISHKL